MLAIAGQPVRAEQVEPLAEALLELEPAAALPRRRRLAVLQGALPLAVARSLADGSRRGEARRAAHAHAASRASGEPLPPGPDGPPAPPELDEVLGGFQELGLPLWQIVRELEPGSRSEAREIPGAFVVVELVERSDAPRGAERWYRVRVARFPYLDPSVRVEEVASGARIEVVDPGWEPIVPAHWRLAGGTPGKGKEDGIR